MDSTDDASTVTTKPKPRQRFLFHNYFKISPIFVSFFFQKESPTTRPLKRPLDVVAKIGEKGEDREKYSKGREKFADVEFKLVKVMRGEEAGRKEGILKY